MSKFVKVKRVGDSTQLIYKMGKRLYEEKPRFTYVKHYLVDLNSERDYAIAVVRHCNYLPHFVVLCMIFAVIFLITKAQPTEQTVRYYDTIYAEDGVISMDLINDKKNKCDIAVGLKYRDVALVDDITLRPGESVSGVPSSAVTKLGKGEYSCELSCVVKNSILPAKEEYWVTLVVR